MTEKATSQQSVIWEPARPGQTITLNLGQATQLLAMFGDEEADISMAYGPGHDGPGLYAWFSDYPKAIIYLTHQAKSL